VQILKLFDITKLMDFPHFFTPDLADELRKSKFLIVQGNFVRLLMSYPGVPGQAGENYVFYEFTPLETRRKSL